MTCSHEQCEKPVRSRGLCVTHYNQTLPTRHRKVTVPCAACGYPCEKEPSQLKKYGAAYCSLLCRDYVQHGAGTCDLPASHRARWYGRTSQWQPPTVASLPPFRCGVCMDCGAPFTERAFSSTPSKWCSRSCQKRVTRRARRAREHEAPGTFTYSQFIKQHIRQGKTCAYCHRPTTSPDPEHVQPLSRGGRNDMSNVVAACRSCNADKRDLLLSEWNDDRARRGLEPVDLTLAGPAFWGLALAA